MSQRVLRFVLLAGLCFSTLAPVIRAQESAPASETAAAEDTNSKWKLINFAIFAALLGYAIFKSAPSFFNARSSDIQKAIKDATGLKMDADLRYSAIDRKMANLSGEVGRLRAESQGEMTREYERLQAQTQEELEYIRKNTAAEIEALHLEGAQQLRHHATQLALLQAESRLRDRFASGEPPELLRDFVKLVEQGKN